MKPITTLFLAAICALTFSLAGFAFGFRTGVQGQVMSAMISDAKINAALLTHLENGNTEFVRETLASNREQDSWVTAAESEINRPLYRFGEFVGRVDLLR